MTMQRNISQYNPARILHYESGTGRISQYRLAQARPFAGTVGNIIGRAASRREPRWAGPFFPRKRALA